MGGGGSTKREGGEGVQVKLPHAHAHLAHNLISVNFISFRYVSLGNSHQIKVESMSTRDSKSNSGTLYILSFQISPCATSLKGRFPPNKN